MSSEIPSIAQSPLVAAESSPAWSEFARSFDDSWKEFKATRLKPVKEWAARELSTVMPSGLTVFYPFSGPDFAFMYSVFPEARTYVMISLERVGRIPDFSTMSNANVDSFFAGLQRSNQDLLHRGYFITKNLETALQQKGMEGILPLLLLFMAREKVRVIDVQHWFMNPDGTIVETPALERFSFEKGSIPGVRIVFQREGHEQTQTLYYLRFDLAKSSFDRHEKGNSSARRLQVIRWKTIGFLVASVLAITSMALSIVCSCEFLGSLRGRRR